MTKRGAKKDAPETTEEKKLSNHAQRALEERRKGEIFFLHFSSSEMWSLLRHGWARRDCPLMCRRRQARESGL